MANAKHDENHVATLLATSNVDGITPVVLWADPTTHRLLVDFSAPLDSLTDVLITNVQNGQVLSYDSGLSKWVNSSAGAGDTIGASASTDGEVVLFSGTNGKALKRSNTISGIALLTSGVLSAAIAGDFPTLNQNTTGSAAKLTTARAIYGQNFDGSAALTLTSRTVGNSTDLDTAMGNLDSALSLLNMNGFSSWTSGTDASTYSIGGGNFTVVRSGQGFVNSKLVTWTANQTIALTNFAANTTTWVYVDSTGTVNFSTSAATVYANIPLFYVWNDGTNYFVVKENHNYNFESKISSYLHATINVVVRGVGAIISRVAGGTGASIDDRRLQITGADTIDDHGLSMTVAATNPISVTTVYVNAGGKFVQYHTQSEITPFWNNAGTPQALDATPNSFCVYTIYISQDDINSSAPRYIAIMDDAAYATLGDAQAAITAGTVTYATNELKAIEPCQLGYAILEYSGTGGYINSVVVARNTFNQALIGGGSAGGSNHALLSNLDFASAGHTGFTAPATTDTFTNKTFDTAGTGNVFKINTYAVSDKTGTGKVVLDTSPTLVTPLLGTPTSGNLANCTFPTLNQNTSGTAAGLSATLVPASGGTGVSNNNSATVTSSGNYAYTRTLTGATNVTFPTTGTLATLAGTETLSDKRITKRYGSTTSSATPTINTDTVDIYELTAQAADVTSFTTNLSGTPVNGDFLEIIITGTAARAITWGTSFAASNLVALPTTTVTTTTLRVLFQYQTTGSLNKWVCVAVA